MGIGGNTLRSRVNLPLRARNRCDAGRGRESRKRIVERAVKPEKFPSRSAHPNAHFGFTSIPAVNPARGVSYTGCKSATSRCGAGWIKGLWRSCGFSTLETPSTWRD